MTIKNYILKSYYCRNEHIHGGVAIYAIDTLTCKEINISMFSKEMQTECCSIEITTSGTKIAIITIYRPPSGDEETFTIQASDVLSHITNICPNMVLCGDLNIDSLKQNNKNFKMLNDLFESFQLIDYSDEPTRIFTTTAGTSKSSIDYMTTNIQGQVRGSVIEPHISDHRLLLLQIAFPPVEEPSPAEPIETRITSEKAVSNLKNRLQYTTWNLNETSCSVDKMFDKFHKTFLYHFNEACPIKKATKKDNNSIWVTEELRTEKQNLRDLYNLAKETQSQILMQEYKNRKKKYRKNIDNAKTSYNGKIIEDSKNKAKTIWNIINNELNRKSRDKKHNIQIDGKIISENQTIANVFGQYFTTIAQQKIQEHFGNNLSTSPTVQPLLPNTIYLQPTTHNEVGNIIMSLKNKNSFGFDGITAKILKKVCDEVKEPLTTLINTSISTGTFPSLLKLATVIPIYKNGDPQDIKNYRPISLLSIFSKVFEKVLYDRIMGFLSHFNLISEEQHGFCANKSTETAGFQLAEFVHKELDKKRVVVGLFFDLTRAFDTLNFDFLHHKLYHLGIRGNALSIIMSFLEERRLLVKIDNSYSQIYHTDMGAPQGSVLAPLLFILFINDLTLPGLTIKFADDTSVAISTEDDEAMHNAIKNICESMSNWCFLNQLILNDSKTVKVHFYRAEPKIDANEDIHTSVKFLGTYMDSKLTWEPQLDHVCSSLNKAYYALLKLKTTIPFSSLMTAYYALVHSHLNYNIILWGQAVGVSRILILQKRIIRLIFGLKRLDSCRPIFRNQRILTVPSIYIMKCAIYVYKNKTDFIRNDQMHPYPTRNRTNLVTPKHSTSAYEKSPYFSCVKVYNQLPTTIKEAPTLTTFRNKLKVYLFNHAFYSHQEFLDLNTKP